MIQLNLDLNYLTQYFEITTQRLNEYSAKSIDEVMELEEQEGNQAASLIASAMQNPDKLAKLLQLIDPKNRYLIIRNLSENDLSKLLPYLEQEDLLWGLKYFRVDKIIEMLNKLPTEELMSVVLQRFTLKDIFLLMPQEDINKFFENQEVERQDVMKYFETLNPSELERILMHQFGNSMKDKTQQEHLMFINSLRDEDFTKMLQNMEKPDQVGLMVGLVKEKPELMEQINPENITRPMRTMEKHDILKCMDVLDPEFLIPMVEELPPDLLQVVATQIDPRIFAQVLIDEFPDVLSKIAL
ncbi:TPA: hypothetical protein IAA86_08385 [Candidatus Galligastranaerophilus intestinavium]|uniref:Magnesium transporter MgtE intracellular domain-containing protein n=1 Tax=Candidatus Galligastranaerophilus intestinavium TaxID=2840836 RepID=A0A9D1JYB1_9BACT|nr:hypothetical protein [Candidatus Galligastranaerophilus intestinavium]